MHSALDHPATNFEVRHMRAGKSQVAWTAQEVISSLQMELLLDEKKEN
jgi:hypothetical protein